jgi:abortive infection bacteriophage resistance protein
MKKPKLSIDEQIDYMKNQNGIQFNIINKEMAKEFLKYNNYYFKLKAYAKNYDKYEKGENKGKYINLEFAYLVEMSKIDMYIRKFIMKMTLDVEHFLKTQLLRDFSDNNTEDGYSIIDELFNKYPYIKDNIQSKKINSACADLIAKYDGEFAIWNIVEVLSFGDFIKLYDLYYRKYKTKNSMENYLLSIKFLRNAAAHNNCLLNTLKTPYSVTIKPNRQINNFISKIPGIKPDARKKKMKNPIIHDFVVLLYVFNSVVVSEGIKKHAMLELKEFLNDRAVRHKTYFEKNELVKSYYRFIKKIVDYFAGLCV